MQARIRKSVKLREAPALGKTIFHHDPHGAGEEDYLALAAEVLERVVQNDSLASTALTLIQGCEVRHV